MSKRRTISVDFDGVLHSYTTPWTAEHIIPDPPVDGAIEWLFKVIQEFDVAILTTRSKTWRGRRAVRAWLKKHAGNIYYESMGTIGLESVVIVAHKVPALVYIDDRGYRFDGANFPSIDAIWKMRPWIKNRA